MYQLSICADTVSFNLPFEVRVKRIVNIGILDELRDWQEGKLNFIPTNNIQIATCSVSSSVCNPDNVDPYVQFAIDTFPIETQLSCSTLPPYEGELDAGDTSQFICSFTESPKPKRAESSTLQDLRYRPTVRPISIGDARLSDGFGTDAESALLSGILNQGLVLMGIPLKFFEQ